MQNRFSISDLSGHLFWDVDYNELSFEKSKKLIIHRVLEFGLMQDWKIIKEIYGLETIKTVALGLRNLDEVTLSFLATLFHLEKENFRCYTPKTSMPSSWNY